MTPILTDVVGVPATITKRDQLTGVAVYDPPFLGGTGVGAGVGAIPFKWVESRGRYEPASGDPAQFRLPVARADVEGVPAYDGRLLVELTWIDEQGVRQTTELELLAEANALGVLDLTETQRPIKFTAFQDLLVAFQEVKGGRAILDRAEATQQALEDGVTGFAALSDQLDGALDEVGQATADALGVTGINPAYISETTVDPPAAPDGTKGAKRSALGLLTRLIRTAGVWVPAGAAVMTVAGLAYVDARHYGVADGANVSTLMSAIAATPDGGTLYIPKVNLTHTGGRLYVNGRKNLTIYGNGVTVTADATLPDTPDNGGFYFIGCQNLDLWDMTYDGRLDTRTPFGSDAANTNLKSGWNVLPGCQDVRLHNIVGTRCMMDGVYVGHGDNTTSALFPNGQVNSPYRTVLDNCTGTYNYRQGLSVVSCNGLTGIGGTYSFTGTLGAGKGTSPKAGIDLEAYEPLGYYNLGVTWSGDTRLEGNAGLALSVQSGTRGARMTGFRVVNQASGINFSSASFDNHVFGVIFEGSGYLAAEPYNVVIEGTNNRLTDSVINCIDGARAYVVKAGAIDCGVRNLTINCAAGTGGAGVGQHDGTGGFVENITVKNGRRPGSSFGLLDARGPNVKVSSLRVESDTSNTDTKPIIVTSAVRHFVDLSASGYTTPVTQPAAAAVTVPVMANPGTPTLTAPGSGGTMSSYTGSYMGGTHNTAVYVIKFLWTPTATTGSAAFTLAGKPAGYNAMMTSSAVYNANAAPVATAVYGQAANVRVSNASFDANPQAISVEVYVTLIKT